MIIKKEFKTSTGNILNIRNVNFESLEDLRQNIGTLVTQSKPEDSSNFEINEEGIYLYRSSYDKNKGLRIYKDFNLYKYIYHDDYKVIFELQQRQKNIKLSEFPTGILTIEDKVIGQEIPFYDNSKTILDYFKTGDMKKRPTQFYLEVLKILKELCNNGIIYRDAHKRNFMVDNITEIVHIIDFESTFLCFNNFNCSYQSMVNNFKVDLINILNLICGIEFSDNYEKAKTLEELEEVILEEDYQLKVK